MIRKSVISMSCLIPTLLGVMLWNILPNKLAIHFGFYGIDGYGSKLIVIFILPLCFFFLNILYHIILIKHPNCLSPFVQSKKLSLYLFPLLSLLVFLISISNTIN